MPDLPESFNSEGPKLGAWHGTHSQRYRHHETNTNSVNNKSSGDRQGTAKGLGCFKVTTREINI